MKNKTIWITGLSGSGKSTLAKKIALRLIKDKHKVLLLDGDILRKIFNLNNNDKNYTLGARLRLAKKYSLLCKEITDQGFNVIISTISLFSEVHKWNRKNLKNYCEIYLKVPMNEIKKRDPKKIYKNFEKGISKNVVGLDLKYDEPKKPDIIIENFTIDYPIDSIIKNIIKRKK
tara:strand:- start:211 stop:732 length:522 start_codon:yes stop_codon:yes gene_type:complete